MTRIADYLGQSAQDNVQLALAAARQHEPVNALLALTEKRALERAEAVDRGEISGRLAGVPFVIKDNILAFGASTTAASRMLADFNAPYQATAVERLEAEGAICIGKTNLDSFAHGGSTENSAFGLTKNALDETRVAGGSSGGSAVAVALGIVPFALGTDTGGSIRQPASFNSVIGFKPSYGVVSRYGVIAMASSTDTVGCFTTTADDAALILEIMAGHDERDGTSSAGGLMAEVSEGPLRIGVIKEHMTSDVDESVRKPITAYIKRLRAGGHTVEEVSIPIVDYALAMYYIIVSAEVSSNMARFDGIRYGQRDSGATSLKLTYQQSRDKGFELETKRRILIGSYVLSSGFYDAYYLKAQKARTLLIKGLSNSFKDYDVLLGPTSPTLAFRIGERVDDPVKAYLADNMTVLANLAGLPAVSLPAGLTSDGLAVGVQLMAGMNRDVTLLALATSLEAKA